MPDEVRHFTATIPAGTPATAPQYTRWAMPPRLVRRIELVIPPGPNGSMGFALTNSGIRVIPWDSDAWVVTNDEKIVWDLTNTTDAGDWGLLGYNTGTAAHSVYARFLVDVPQLHAAIVGAEPLTMADWAGDTGLVAAPQNPETGWSA